MPVPVPVPVPVLVPVPVPVPVPVRFRFKFLSNPSGNLQEVQRYCKYSHPGGLDLGVRGVGTSETDAMALCMLLAYCPSALASRLPVIAPRAPAISCVMAAGSECATSVGSDEELLRELYEMQQAQVSMRKDRANRVKRNLDALGAMRDSFSFGQPPALLPHDIDVIEIDDGRLTADALALLLSHEACAVHVRNFCAADECRRIEASLSDESLYSNWAINRLSDEEGVASEVDKVGVVANEALDSFDDFREYLAPSNGGLDALLPAGAGCDPFKRLLEQLDCAHPEGCRRDRLGRWTMPAGTFRRMRSSKGLVHADTATLLSHAAGEFSANLYVRTPPVEAAGGGGGGGGGSSKGALCVYPTRQYTSDGGVFGVTSPALLADLQALARRQAEGFSEEAQEYIRAALPIERRLELRDGDLVLINTGRFHGVEPYAEGYRLSGQSWLSYRKGKPLKLWV